MTDLSRPFSPLRTLFAPVLICAWLGVATVSAQPDDPVASLPPGPKTLLTELSDDPAVITAMVGATRSSEDWLTELAGMGTTMTEDQQRSLADYLALNGPVVASGGDVASIVQALPADGRELFAATCSACHGVASYYLLQDRDTAGWMDIFGAPYHRRLLTGENERETFASYAAHAMPIPAEQIPEAWKQ